MARAPHSSIFASLDLVVERAAWNGLRIVDVDAEVDALLRQFAEFRPNKDELRLELAHLATTHGITIRMGAS